MKRRAPLAWVAVCAGVLAHASPAHAQGAPDLAGAEALFDEGKRLVDHGDYAAACPKLAASLRLDVGIGTMLYLADCEAHLGHTATAWGQFREAAAIAARQHDARETIARTRAAELEPRLARLTIAVESPTAPELVVKRDGQALERAAWGIGVPVDPGTHVVEASAPGRASFRTSVAVPIDAKALTVSVPALESSPTSGVVAPAPPPDLPSAVRAGAPLSDRAPSSDAEPSARTNADAPSSSSRPLDARRIGALVAGGAGVVGLGLGTFWAVRAKGDLDDSNADGHCHGNACDHYGVSARSDAQSQATLATAGFIVGGVALAAGAVLWLTAPRAAVHVAVAPGGVRDPAFVVVGAF